MKLSPITAIIQGVLPDQVMTDVCDYSTWHGMIHACEFETSLMLSVNEELVKMDKAVKEYPTQFIWPIFHFTGSLSKSGVFGDATFTTKDKGEEMLLYLVKEMKELLLEAYNEAVNSS